MSVRPISVSTPFDDYPRLRLRARDAEMSYVDAGTGDPVVFLRATLARGWTTTGGAGLRPRAGLDHGRRQRSRRYHPTRLKISETTLPQVLTIDPRVHGDARGWFLETYNAARFRDAGLPETFVQDNHSYSRGGVVRGLHYQLHEPQGKLVRCTRGRILDVAVDIRRTSPHFGKWVAVELTAENRRMLWIPPRFAHGFAVLSDDAEVLYKCTTQWHAATDRSILWNDPDLGIDWGIAEPQLSAKDAQGKPLADADVFD